MGNRKESKELLRPVNYWFIIFSMLIGLLLNFIPIGKLIWRPDILVVILIYWSIHQPKKVSFLLVFCLGIMMDVHYGVLLGQHALTYVLTCFIAVIGSRRIVWFDLIGQMLHILPILIFSHALLLLIYIAQGGVGVSWAILAAPFIEVLLWPIADLLLLRPQKGAPEKSGGL